jgi:hypothetical protein
MWIEPMGNDPPRRPYDLQLVIFGGLFVAAVLAVTVNMLGGGWLGAAIVFVGVNTCAWWLARRIDRYYDRIRGSDDRPS